MGRCSKETNLPFNNPGGLEHPKFLQKIFNNLKLQMQDFPAPCLIFRDWWLSKFTSLMEEFR